MQEAEEENKKREKKGENKESEEQKYGCKNIRKRNKK